MIDIVVPVVCLFREDTSVSGLDKGGMASQKQSTTGAIISYCKQYNIERM